MLSNPIHRTGGKWYLWLYENKSGPIEKVANGERQYGSGSLKGQCAAGAQVLCGRENSDVPKVSSWRAGLTIFEMWGKNIGVPVGVVMASFSGNGEYVNAPGGAGQGNHTILYLGHNNNGTYNIADQYHYIDSSGNLHSQNYTIHPVSGEYMSRFRVVMTNRIYD